MASYIVHPVKFCEAARQAVIMAREGEDFEVCYEDLDYLALASIWECHEALCEWHLREIMKWCREWEIEAGAFFDDLARNYKRLCDCEDDDEEFWFPVSDRVLRFIESGYFHVEIDEKAA